MFHYTPEPRPLKKGTFDSNAAINSEGSGDMSSTQYNQIWSSANSFFRNRQKFACFLEHWPEILIAVNWQWSLGKNSSLSKNWDYWEIAENMVKMHNLHRELFLKEGFSTFFRLVFCLHSVYIINYKYRSTFTHFFLPSCDLSSCRTVNQLQQRYSY